MTLSWARGLEASGAGPLKFCPQLESRELRRLTVMAILRAEMIATRIVSRRALPGGTENPALRAWSSFCFCRNSRTNLRKKLVRFGRNRQGSVGTSSGGTTARLRRPGQARVEGGGLFSSCEAGPWHSAAFLPFRSPEFPEGTPNCT